MKNIIIILYDSLRSDLFQKNASKLPNLGRISASSISFTRAYSTSCWTRPAMASLFTGLWVHNHNVRMPSDIMPKGIPAIAEILKSRGYYTMGINVNPYCIDPSFKKGFDLYLDRFDKNRKMLFKILFKAFGRFLPKGVSDRLFFEAYERIAPAGKLVDAAKKAIARNAGKKPLFVFLEMMDTHYPYCLGFSRYKELIGLVESRDKERLEEISMDSLVYVDECTGRLLDFLEQHMPDSCMVFLSDHGTALFEHGGFGTGHMKGLYEEVIRIPLLICDRGLSARGKAIQKPARIIDILPTILEIAGIDYSGLKIDGSSLVPLAKGIEKGCREVIAQSGSSHPVKKRRGEEQIAVIHEGKWKYILFKKSGREELFNLITDPKEKKNLISKHRDIAKKLKAGIACALPEGKSAGKHKYEEDILKELKALGYVQDSKKSASAQ